MFEFHPELVHEEEEADGPQYMQWAGGGEADYVLSTNDIPRDADKTGIAIVSHKMLATSASDNDENKLSEAFWRSGRKR